MASSLALRRASLSLFSKLRSPVHPGLIAPSVTRSFNTNAQIKRYEGEESDLEMDRRSDRRRDAGFFSDVWDPFSPTRSLSQILNQMDQFMENPFFTVPRGMGGGASRRPWDVKEDNNGLYIRMDMPGVGKENVKVSIEQNTLVIRGQGEKESEDEEGGRYTSRIDLPANTYNLGDIKAEMKNGVLKVVVPKVKEEERKDVFHVNVD